MILSTYERDARVIVSTRESESDFVDKGYGYGKGLDDNFPPATVFVAVCVPSSGRNRLGN